MNDLDMAQFLRSRSEAAMWCHIQGQRSSLRTPSLRPVVSEWPTPTEFDAALNMLRQRRREMLEDKSIESTLKGRLLLCQLNESVSSGESEFATAGFFDINDRPPWDTWVWRLDSSEDSDVTLVSWVPEELEAVVAEGIDANPYGCIYWLTDEPLGMKPSDAVRALVSAGIR